MRLKTVVFVLLLFPLDSIAQSLHIFRKQGDCISLNIEDVDSLKFSPEQGDNNFSEYVHRYENLSSLISGMRTDDRLSNFEANRYIDLLLSQYNAYEKIHHNQSIPPAISVSDDDTIDPQLDGPLTGKRTGGYYSTLFPYFL